MRRVIVHLTRSMNFFHPPDVHGIVRWKYQDSELMALDEEHRLDVRTVGAILGYYILWMGTGCLPISLWTIYSVLVENEHAVTSLDLETIARLDPVAGRVLRPWPLTAPGESTAEILTLAIDYNVVTSVRFDHSILWSVLSAHNPGPW